MGRIHTLADLRNRPKDKPKRGKASSGVQKRQDRTIRIDVSPQLRRFITQWLRARSIYDNLALLEYERFESAPMGCLADPDAKIQYLDLDGLEDDDDNVHCGDTTTILDGEHAGDIVCKNNNHSSNSNGSNIHDQRGNSNQPDHLASAEKMTGLFTFQDLHDKCDGKMLAKMPHHHRNSDKINPTLATRKLISGWLRRIEINVRLWECQQEWLSSLALTAVQQTEEVDESGLSMVDAELDDLEPLDRDETDWASLNNTICGDANLAAYTMTQQPENSDDAHLLAPLRIFMEGIDQDELMTPS
ncbi:hypothetical protein Micbo1qcDRAFT_201847 [Microdochium bolleyi]|uniref:Uncharacterized protein n=1 Tax=Microdochium bolleyi TaxID=196109 RepID=A0A136JA19_9PEZI|nr:hypothetical protein Micbo1qcDRAFT_201847 [Microdochium bolleyi]